jgi:hypothetical protein
MATGTIIAVKCYKYWITLNYNEILQISRKT